MQIKLKIPIWRYLPDFNVLDFSFSDLTSGKEVETFTEECSDSELLK